MRKIELIYLYEHIISEANEMTEVCPGTDIEKRLRETGIDGLKAIKFDSMAEVIEAVDNEIKVQWKDGYEVIQGKGAGHLVRFRGNGHCVGLMHADGVGSEYLPTEFSIEVSHYANV